jgi:AraC-like DNA-binding protein
VLKHLKPNIGELMSFTNHTMIWVKLGHGIIEVDFKAYSEVENRLIFLSPNQPIKFLSGDLEIAVLEFPAESIQGDKEYRVLFKHLIALGYIDFSEEMQGVFEALLNETPAKILDVSKEQWFWQNPFDAKKEEYTLIFDLKEVIDAHFTEKMSVEQLIANVQTDQYSLQKLVKSRLGLTVKDLAQRKLLIESQKDIAFTDKPIQEVAYDLGFKDPAYFNRFFKQSTQLTPAEFRENFGNNGADEFIQDLLLLIRDNFKSQRSTAYYADKTHSSIHTLSRKVKDKLNMTVGDLIRTEIINSAKLLLTHSSIKNTAFELGFEEANHFSAFFKKYTGQTPSEYLSTKKYNF